MSFQIKFWLIVLNPSEGDCDFIKEFKEMPIVEHVCKQNLHEGDLCYIYLSHKIGRIIAKAKVINNMEVENIEAVLKKQATYRKFNENYNNSLSKNEKRYWLKCLVNYDGIVDFPFNYTHLTQFGLKAAALKHSIILNNNPELLKYIFSTEERLNKNIVQRNQSAQNVRTRNPAIKNIILDEAQHQCLIDSTHEHFVSNSTKKNYVEVHHVIPLSLEHFFMKNLDIKENLVALCSVCHNQIHYAIKEEKKTLLDQLFELKKSFLSDYFEKNVPLKEFYQYYDKFLIAED